MITRVIVIASIVIASMLLSACSEETPIGVDSDALTTCVVPVDAVILTLYRVTAGSTDCRECVYCGTCDEIESRSVCLDGDIAANEADLDELIRGTQFDSVLLNVEYCIAVAMLDADGAVECDTPQDGWREALRGSGVTGACLMTELPVRPDGPSAELMVGEVACDDDAVLDGCVLRDPRLDGTRANCCNPDLEFRTQCTSDGSTVLECDGDREGVLARSVCAAGTSCEMGNDRCLCDSRSFPRCGPGSGTVQECSGGALEQFSCASGSCDPSDPMSCR